jgi:hypothetical protein
MPQPTNLIDRYDLTTIRENLSDIIRNVNPDYTPFTSLIGTQEVTSTTSEWTVDSYDAFRTTPELEGDDTALQVATQPVRVTNNTQILKRNFGLSGTARSLNVVGGQDEFDRLAVKKAIELKRDREAALVRNQARLPGTNGSPTRQARTLEAWFSTNTSRGVGGASGGDLTAATDGTPRAFAESQIQAVAEAIRTNSGAFPRVLMCHPTQRKNLDNMTLTGVSRQMETETGTVNKTVDFYRTPFGTLEIIDNYAMRTRTMVLLTPEDWAVGYLTGREMDVYDLAKIGDNSRAEMVTEFTLISRNEASSGVIADLS